MSFFKGKTVFVLGLGRSGRTTARMLETQGANVLVWDDLPGVREVFQNGSAHLQPPATLDWSTVDLFVISPGIPHHHPAPHPVAILAQLHDLSPIGDIECFFKLPRSAPVIGITGTNGKSTTTALLTHLFQQGGTPATAVGNIGTPILAVDTLPESGFYVLELSSYQLELTPSLELACAVLLNVSPDHLERHGGLEGYVGAKKRIFKGAPFGVLGIDDPITQGLADAILAGKAPEDFPKSWRFISGRHMIEGGIACVDGVVYDQTEPDHQQILDLRTNLALQGTHNHQNVAAAYAIGSSFGLSPEVLKQGLLSFGGLAHRQEYVGVHQGVRYYNDSKATNPEATEKALTTLGKNHALYWIVGGRPKQKDLSSLTHVLPMVNKAFLIGEAAQQFLPFFQEHRVPHTVSYTLEAACEQATQQALMDGGVDPAVLLSPACTSFDQFQNFEQRGNAFKDWVYALSKPNMTAC